MKNRCVYIGRFQPFHNGHFDAIKQIANNGLHDELLIIVGHNLGSHTVKDPFKCGERVEMIDTVLENADFDIKVSVRGVTDIANNDMWVDYVASQIPSFTTIYSNNPLVVRLVKESKYEIAPITLHSRETCRGHVIRELMLTKADWSVFVPPEIYNFITENKLDERMIELNGTDY